MSLAQSPAGQRSPVDVTQLLHLEPFQRLAAQCMPEFVRVLADNNEDNGSVEAWQRWALNQRVLVDVSSIDTSTTVVGTPLALPVIIAPFALQSFAHPDGEIATATGASRAGTTLGLSLATSRSYAEVGAAATNGFWVHMAFMTERPMMLEVIHEAAGAGATAVCLTVDMPTGAWWPPAERAAALEMMLRLEEQPTYLSQKYFTPAMQRAKQQALLRDDRWDSTRPAGSSATWADLDWLRGESPIPIVLKGILNPADARRAAEHGAAAIVVSNHGGHGLREARPTAEALPEIAEAVGDRLEVLVDGGIRGAADVIRAIALGARAVLIGRRALWGLAVGGADGVARVLELFREELEVLMGLVGVRSIAEIDASAVVERRGCGHDVGRPAR